MPEIISLPIEDTVLDEPYFRTSQCAPYTDGEKIYMYQGYGTSRSWGTPKVSSFVEHRDDQTVQIRVVGWHRNSVSPEGGDFYFVRKRGQWRRTTAQNKIIRALLSL